MPLYYYVVMFVRLSLTIKGYLLTYLLNFLIISFMVDIAGSQVSKGFPVQRGIGSIMLYRLRFTCSLVGNGEKPRMQ